MVNAPPQFSPDGKWWWDGSKWVPASQAPESSPAFGVGPRKPGFWGSWPRWLTVVLAILVLPVTGFIFIWRRAWSSRIKWGATGAWAVLLLITLVVSATAGGSPATPTASSSSPSAGRTASSPESTAASSVESPSPPTIAQAAAKCLPGLPHVYNPDRLKVLNPCVTVTGTVDLVRSEADGDYHVRLHLEPGQLCAGQNCLDATNMSQQAGDLVVEPVCEHSISQADAVSACSGYHNTEMVPPVGTHTTVTGPWVLDQDHGWNEIHPAEMIDSSSMPTGSAPPPAPAPATFSVTITASQYGYVAAKTSPGAVCSAQAQLPSGRISTASALQIQDTAGSDGMVSWTYRTSSTTTHGTGTHTVTCNLNGQTASASAPFTVG